jgi:hypothetical protein
MSRPMRVYWTLVPTHGGLGIGLWDDPDDAQAVVDRYGLAHRQDMASTPVYAAGLPDSLADLLVAAGVAEDVIESFDGSSGACERLARALHNAGTDVGADAGGQPKDEAEHREAITLAMAGRLCRECGRVATVAGYLDGQPRLACSRHADLLDTEVPR